MYDTKMLTAEMRLASRLRELGEKSNPFAGGTWYHERREKMRVACLRHKDKVFAGEVTIGQMFVRTYQCDL